MQIKDSGIYIDLDYVAYGVTDERSAEEIASYFAEMIYRQSLMGEVFG